MRDWSQRKTANLKVPAPVGRMFAHLAPYKDANVFPVNPPRSPSWAPLPASTSSCRTAPASATRS